MAIGKCRKLPVVHDFIQFRGYSNLDEVLAFLGSAGSVERFLHDGIPTVELRIHTLEDGVRKDVRHVASEDDYILKGVSGEFWPIKDEIFRSTYEIISDD